MVELYTRKVVDVWEFQPKKNWLHFFNVNFIEKLGIEGRVNC